MLLKTQEDCFLIYEERNTSWLIVFFSFVFAKRWNKDKEPRSVTSRGYIDSF